MQKDEQRGAKGASKSTCQGFGGVAASHHVQAPAQEKCMGGWVAARRLRARWGPRLLLLLLLRLLLLRGWPVIKHQ